MNIFNTKIQLRAKVLQQLITSENACVEMVQQERDIQAMPYHGNNVASATKEQLNTLIGKYVKDLYGIVLGYKNIKILTNYTLVDEDGLNNFSIRADFFVFKPIPGRELPAIVTKKSKDHVGCLIYNTFNMSIPKPDGVANWLGYKVEVGEEVVARVTLVKLESRIPYIRGEFLEETKVNRRIKFTDDDETIPEEKEKSLDKENGIDICSDAENIPNKRKKSRKSSENKIDKMTSEEPTEDVNDKGSIKIVQDDLLRKKTKKSRRSLENVIDKMNLTSDEHIEITKDYCSDEMNNPVYDDVSVRKKKKKSRKSHESEIDNCDGYVEMKDNLDELDKKTVSEQQKDDSVKKQKSRRSLEIDEVETERKSKKRRNSTVSDEGEAKKRKMV